MEELSGQHKVQPRSYPSSVNSTENSTVLSHRSSVVLRFSSFPPSSPREFPPGCFGTVLERRQTRRTSRSRSRGCIADVELRHPRVTLPRLLRSPAHLRYLVRSLFVSSILSFRFSLSLFLSVSPRLSLASLSLSRRRAPFDLRVHTNHEASPLSVTIHLSLKCVKGPPTPSANSSVEGHYRLLSACSRTDLRCLRVHARV